MLHLQRLGVQGIRSFSPDEPQEIKFYPLTVIHGRNGAGKTSIIESLKYISTGQLPPNSNNGKTFVHDIQLADVPIVRAQVRLRFTDIQNKTTVVTRTLETTMKYIKSKPKITFRQMNSVIKRDNKSNDQKCMDINSELLELFGVSKAVLSNVIFCHQEETNWPLSEGKVLKEKFDDIFGSIGYVKVLDKIKKLREEEVKNLKLLEKDVSIASRIKKEHDSKKHAIQEDTVKLNSEKSKISQLDSKIHVLTEKLNDLIEKESSAEEIMNEVSLIQGSINEKNSLIKSIQSNLKHVDFENIGNIDEDLANFDANVNDLKCKEVKTKEQLAQIESDVSRFSKEKQNVCKEEAKIDEIKNQLERLEAKRKNVVSSLDILENVPNDKVIDTLQSNIQRLQTELSQKETSFTEKESSFRKELESLKHERSNHAHEKVLRSKELQQYREQIDSLQTNADSFVEDIVDKLNEEILEGRQKLEALENVDEEELRANVDSLSNENNSLKRYIDKLSQQIADISLVDNEKRKYEEAKISCLNSLETLKQNTQHVFTEINSQEGGFYDKLMIELKQMQHSFDKITEQSSKVTRELSDKETNKRLLQEKIDRDERELVECKSKLEKICPVNQFETFLKHKENELNETRLELSKCENIAPVVDWQISVIVKSGHCPVCENDLSKGWTSHESGQHMDTQRLVRSLKDKKQDNPDEVEQLRGKLQTQSKFYERLLTLKRDVESIKSIQSTLPKLKDDLSALNNQIDGLRSDVDEQNAKLKEMKRKIDQFQYCLTDARDYDNAHQELKKLNQSLSQIQAKQEDAICLEDLQQIHEQKLNKQKQVEQKLDQLQSDLFKLVDDRVAIRSSIQNAELKKLNYEKQQQEKMTAINKKQELKQKIDHLEETIQGLKTKSSLLEPEISKVEEQLNTLVAEQTGLRSKLKEKINSNQNMIVFVSDLDREINIYSKDLEQCQLKSSTKYIDELNGKLEKSLTAKTKLNEQMHRLMRDIANAEVKRKELLECQRLIELKNSILSQNEKLVKYKAKLGDMDLTDVKKMRIQLERESQSFVTKKQTCFERINEIKQRITIVTKELNVEEFRNVNTKYEDILTDKILCEVTCDDLDKYYKALDFSISSFHRSKMDEINKLIQKFWEIAYQGKDIDCIRILADEEERSASDKRKTYHYRVAMVKNNKVMDMKGRCSAGQKVLASLIIRLALSIIFCKNFNVLTLDEPTTNLDKANVRSFAKAVMSLVKSNRNFQIVIITHDDVFLQCLDPGQYYYKVYKNDRGYSVIERKSIVNDDEGDGEGNEEENDESNNTGPQKRIMFDTYDDIPQVRPNKKLRLLVSDSSELASGSGSVDLDDF